MSKKILMTGLITVMLAGGIMSVQPVQAADSWTDPMTNIVNKIAEKFNLKKDNVQSVFDEMRAERQEERQKMFEQNLTQAVTDGKLTEAQKKLILDKHNEMVKEQGAKRGEMRDWLEKNNIDPQWLGGFGRGRGMHDGFGGRWQ